MKLKKTDKIDGNLKNQIKNLMTKCDTIITTNTNFSPSPVESINLNNIPHKNKYFNSSTNENNNSNTSTPTGYYLAETLSTI